MDPALPDPARPHLAAARSSRRLARVVLAAILIGLGLYLLEGFLRALIWAAILAVATAPLYRRARARLAPGRHDILLPALFTAGTALLIVTPLALLGTLAAGEARGVAAWLATAQRDGLALPQVLAHLPVLTAPVTDWWNANLTQPEDARALLSRVDAELLTLGRTLGPRALHGAVIFGFTVMTLFVLYRQGDSVATQMRTASRRLFGRHGEEVGEQIVASIHGTVSGLVLVGLAVGVLLGIGYWLAGVPRPALLACATVIGAMLPLGATLMLALACLLVLAQGHIVTAVVLGAGGMAVVFVADHFVRPALIGGATRLPFLWVLLGILGGVERFGLLGLFVGPAIMAALILLWREWVRDARTTPA